MVPQYDPWNAGGTDFGFPRSSSPAFQREWETLQSSGVLITAANGVTQTLVEPVSAQGVGGVNTGKIYIWGITFVTNTTAPGAIRIHNVDDDQTYCVAVATRQGPFFLSLPTPLEVTENSGLMCTSENAVSNMYCTPMYTTSTERFVG